MKVAELIARLQEFPEDTDVHFSYNYGDHWRTTVAPEVTDIFEGKVQYSEYHRMNKLADEYYDDDDEEKTTWVVILG